MEPLTLARMADDPHAALAELRRRSPVAWVDQMEGWLVTGRAECLAVMRDAATYTVDDPRFTTAQVIGPSMLSRDGGEHARRRTPFARDFRLDRIRERFAESMRREAAGILEPLRRDGQAELRAAFTGPLSVRIVAEALGLDDVAPARVLDWYRAIVAAVSELTAGHAQPDGTAAAVAELNTHLRRVLDRPGTDSLLAASLAGGALAEPEALSNAAVIMFGGIDTTDGMLANAVWHLLREPAELARVRAGEATLAQALEESLRLEPAAAFVDRYATCDVELAGAAIRRGDLVRVSITAANRDPVTFPDPDRFDVRRENARHHLAFAQGPHVCLGMHLARLEGVAGLDVLLQTLPGLRLEPGNGDAPGGLVFRRPARLPVVWDVDG
jgi:cytochrome P450